MWIGLICVAIVAMVCFECLGIWKYMDFKFSKHIPPKSDLPER